MNPTLHTWEVARRKVAAWLLQGVSPERLAVTLAVGFVLGCIPVLGVPTALCAVVAIALRLNLPAIQAANYVAMPFQVALIVPFVRMGGKLAPALARPRLDIGALAHSPFTLLMHSSRDVAVQLGLMAGQALLAWLVVALPVVVLLALILTGVLRRVPVLTASQPQD